VKEIRRLRQTGMSSQELAGRFSLGKNEINRICAGKKWKHVEGKIDLTRTYAAGEEEFKIEQGIPNIQRGTRGS
jgi:hypothetical protein